MKTISFYMTAVFVLFTFHGITQVKVYEDNRVKIFGDKPTDDPNKDLSVQVYGTYGEYLANGKLGFGTYGIDEMPIHRKRIFVGELGNNVDSDQLELCGSTGSYLTWGQGYDYGNIIGKAVIEWELINDVFTEVRKFSFNTDVYADGIILNSDERFKENIQSLKKPTSKIRRVRGVTYNLKEEGYFQNSDGFSPETEKEKNDLALLETTKEKMKNLNRNRIGFLAEDIQEVFPDLVEKDSKGYLHVDYIGLIPVLVESIKEQQTQIAMLNKILQAHKP